MKIWALICCVGYLILGNQAYATSSHPVKSYYKKNGRYVKAYRATNSNRTQRDNWSSKPNTNPYTGKQGTKDPQR